jgi:hypothetical protein
MKKARTIFQTSRLVAGATSSGGQERTFVGALEDLDKPDRLCFMSRYFFELTDQWAGLDIVAGAEQAGWTKTSPQGAHAP